MQAIGPSSNMSSTGSSPKITMPNHYFGDQSNHYTFFFLIAAGERHHQLDATHKPKTIDSSRTRCPGKPFLGFMKLTGTESRCAMLLRQGSADGAGVEKGERAYLHDLGERKEIVFLVLLQSR